MASTVIEQDVQVIDPAPMPIALETPEVSEAVAEQAEAVLAEGQWPLWEVFTQSEQGAPHEHAGSLHATDAEHALQNARDVYARRGGVISIWVVPSAAVTASTPSDSGPFFDPGAAKAYRHPQF